MPGQARIRAGQLDKRITFQTFTPAADSEGQPIRTWSNIPSVATMWASFEEMMGRGEFQSADKINSQRVGIFTIRHRADFVDGTYGPGNLRIIPGTDSPSLHLRLGELSGTTAADSSGNGLHGTYLNAPTLGAAGAITGDTDAAVTLNGTTQYVTVADNPLLDPGNTFTLELWAYPLITVSINSVLLSKGTNGYVVGMLSGGVIYLGKQGLGSLIAGATLSLTPNAWHHIVFTKDGADAHVYVNGVDVTMLSVDSTIAATATSLNIGRQSDGTQFWLGSIDEVKIYPAVLSASRVRAHYGGGRGLPCWNVHRIQRSARRENHLTILASVIE